MELACFIGYQFKTPPLDLALELLALNLNPNQAGRGDVLTSIGIQTIFREAGFVPSWYRRFLRLADAGFGFQGEGERCSGQFGEAKGIRRITENDDA